MIDALIPYVEAVAGVSLFLGVVSYLIGLLLSAFTGRHDGGRFL